MQDVLDDFALRQVREFKRLAIGIVERPLPRKLIVPNTKLRVEIAKRTVRRQLNSHEQCLLPHRRKSIDYLRVRCKARLAHLHNMRARAAGEFEFGQHFFVGWATCCPRVVYRRSKVEKVRTMCDRAGDKLPTLRSYETIVFRMLFNLRGACLTHMISAPSASSS
jgi:hypothetical protein